MVSAVVVLALIFGLSQEPDGCAESYRADKMIYLSREKISAEVADSADEQQRGLSDRACIGANQGMLFEFPRPGYYNFWMKDMQFPIDIVWMDDKKRVVEVAAKVQPSTFPDTFAATESSQYVLELAAGRAAELGITPGVVLEF